MPTNILKSTPAEALLPTFAGKSLLWVAATLSPTVMEACEELDIGLRHQLPSAILPASRFDAAFVDGGLDFLALTEGRTLLGTLRNSISDDVWVLTQSPSWQLADFIALGFKQELNVPPPWRLFRYFLANYNHQRSWNNARYWANPQNFNRYRW